MITITGEIYALDLSYLLGTVLCVVWLSFDVIYISDISYLLGTILCVVWLSFDVILFWLILIICPLKQAAESSSYTVQIPLIPIISTFQY